MDKKCPIQIYKKALIKDYVEWYLKRFGAATSKKMYNYAMRENIFSRNYLPDPQSFVENVVNKCKNRTCGYDPLTGMWYLLKRPQGDKEAFLEKFAVN